MNIDALKADLRGDEGLRLTAYQDDSAGKVWTIGYGHTRFVNEGMTCTPDQAEAWLLEDIGHTISALDNHAIWWRHLPEPAQRALCNMGFNMGWPRLSGFEQMLAALERGDFLDAAAEAFHSRWAFQVGDGPGKREDRAERVAALYEAAANQGVS